MLEILNLDIEGINSFTQQAFFSFNPGTTVIKGANGAGKTTVIEALFYSLFGKFLNRELNNEDFMSSNRNMKLNLTFKYNNQIYEINRKLIWRGRDKNRRVAPKAEIILPTGDRITQKTAVDSKICEILGFNDKVAENAIYSRQGQIDKLIHLQPAKLKEEFSKILRLGRYKKATQAWNYVNNNASRECKRLSDECSELTDEIKNLDSLREGLEKKNTKFNNMKRDFDTRKEELAGLTVLKNEKTSLVTKREEIIVRIQEYKDDIRRLDQEKVEIEQLPLYNNTIEYNDELLSTERNRMTKREKQSQNLTKVIQELKIHTTKIENYENELISLNGRIKERVYQIKETITKLKEESNYKLELDLENNIEVLKETIQDRLNQLEVELKKNNERKENYRTVEGKKRRKKEEKNKLKFNKDVLQNFNTVLTRLSIEIPEELNEEVKANVSSTILQLEKDKEQLLKNIAGLEAEETEIQSKMDILTESIKNKSNIIRHLKEIGEHNCPTCGSVLDKEFIIKNSTRLKNEIVEHKKEFNSLQESLTQKIKELKNSNVPLKIFEEFSFLQKSYPFLNLIQDIIHSENEIKQIKQKIRLITEKFDLTKINEEILDSKEREIHSIENNIKLILTNINELGKEKDSLKQKEQQCLETGIEMQNLLKSHGFKEDQALTDLEERLKQLGDELTQVQNHVDLISVFLDNRNHLLKHTGLLERKQEEEKGIDTQLTDKKFTGLDENLRTLDKKIEEIRNCMTNLSEEIGKLKATIETKEEQERKLEEKTIELSKEKAIRSYSKEIGQLIKLIEPAVLSNHTRRIETKTNSILKDLPSQSGVFQIKIIDEKKKLRITANNRNTDRKIHSLSGGEITALAFAIRVAISREIANCGFLVLDEPTYGLDEERKKNLAEILASQRHVEQLLVISHDDAFDGFSGHLIDVEQRGGSSRNASYERGEFQISKQGIREID